MFHRARGQTYLQQGIYVLEGFDEMHLWRIAAQVGEALQREQATDILRWLPTRTRARGLRIMRNCGLEHLRDHEILWLFALVGNHLGIKEAAELFAVQAAYAEGRLDESLAGVDVAVARAEQRRGARVDSAAKATAAKRRKAEQWRGELETRARKLHAHGTPPNRIVGKIAVTSQKSRTAIQRQLRTLLLKLKNVTTS